MSSKGQIAIPKALRERLHLREGVELSLDVHGEELVLRKLVKRDWRRWSGRFPRSGMLAELEAEHRDEVRHDEKGP